MHLVYVVPGRAVGGTRAPFALRLAGHTVEQWRRAPATLIGRPQNDAIIVDAVGEPSAGRQYCRELALLRVSAPVLAVIDEASFPEMSIDWRVGDILLDSSGAREIDARIRRAVSRRERDGVVSVHHHGDLTLDDDGLTLCNGQSVIALTRTEHAALKLFFDSPHALVTHRMLWERVSLCEQQMSSGNIDAVISRLRRKLGNAGDRIEGMRGTGYRLVPPDMDSLARATA